MVKNLPASVGHSEDTGLIPGLGRRPGEGNGNPPPAFWPGKSHGQSQPLAGGRKESDITEHAHTLIF